MLLLLKATQFHLFRRHESDTACTEFHAYVFIPKTQSQSPLESLFLPCRKEGYLKFKEKKKGKTHNQNSQCYLMEFIPQDRNSHTGQGKEKIPPPFLNITFHTVNPSEFLLWNE